MLTLPFSPGLFKIRTNTSSLIFKKKIKLINNSQTISYIIRLAV